MFDPKIIREQFLGLVGLRQNDDPDFAQLNSALVYTGNNILLNHPLINSENIELTAKQFSQFSYPAWNIATPYAIGDRVSYLGNLYSAINANIGQLPTGSDWELLNLVSLYLEDIFNTTSEEVVNEMFNLKRVNRATKTLIQSTRFYEGVGNLNEKILNEGKLVGIRIDLLHSQNIVSIIERIGLQLTAASPAVLFYVYHSSQPEPIATFSVNHTISGGFQWHNPINKIKLHNLNQQYDTGGSFFIMYDQNSLASQAVNKRLNFNNVPCSGCTPYNYQTFVKVSKYMRIAAVSVKIADRVTAGLSDPIGIDLWNIDATEFTPDINWGLNFDLTVRCDLTEFLTRQKDVFAFALRDNILVKLLDNMVNSTRQNGIETKVSQMAQIALSSEKLGGGGLREKAAKQIEMVNFEVSELDQVCMPTSKAGGIRVTSVGLSNRGTNLGR